MVSNSFARNALSVLSCMALLSACGGGSGGQGGSSGSTPTYKLGGTINGIQSGNQLTLTNGSDTITVSSNGGFTFDQGVAAGTLFNVTANSSSQPCMALFSNGTMTSAGVSNVKVHCGPLEHKTFQASGSLATPREGGTLYPLSDGSAVLIGGAYQLPSYNPALQLEHYNPASQTWTPYQSQLPSTIYASTQLANGTIIATTGAVTQVFDPVADTLSAANPFASLTGASMLIQLQDGRVLASDGAKVELLDPSTGKWSVGPAMISDHGTYPVAVVLESGKVLVSGGMFDGDYMIGNSEVFDPVALTWTAVGSMITPRSGHTAILMPGGKVLAVAGSTGTYSIICSTSCYSPVASAELFDPATGQWTAAGSMATARDGASATLMPTGKVLVVGGNVPSQSTGEFGGPPYTLPTTLSSTEIYDPQANSWSAWGSLINARTTHAATLLSSGELLIAGGLVAIPGNDPSAATNWTDQLVAPSEVGW